LRLFENKDLKSGRSDESPLDNLPKSDKGALRILTATRKLSQPDYRPEQKDIFLGNPLQRDRIFKGGLNGDSMPENVPEHNRADYEVVHSNNNNAFVIIGRDRPSSKSSGYGNLGATGAGAIYLKTGIATPPKMRGKEVKVYAENNFKTDAAGIYVSQLTDIDNNYELARGSLSLRNKSGIGLKADGVRIIARENIKLVTGPFTKEQDSLGGKRISYNGIDIIAGNNDENLQPMVLGRNLENCLKDMLSLMTGLSAMMDQFIIAQDNFENALTKHNHPLSTTSTGEPLSILSDPIVKSSKAIKAARMTQNVNTKLISWREEIADFRARYLDSKAGSDSILSAHNKVN
jgi:hypothetical protein